MLAFRHFAERLNLKSAGKSGSTVESREGQVEARAGMGEERMGELLASSSTLTFARFAAISRERSEFADHSR
jgi:hypothetical protein